MILKGDARQITDVPQIYAGMMTDIQQYVDSSDINIVLEQIARTGKRKRRDEARRVPL